MAAKTTAHGAPLSLVPPAITEAPPVIARKRARRARVAIPPPPVEAPKVEIDLTRADAKKALAAAFPVETPDTEIVASEREDLAALAYIEARDAQARAEGVKDASGNILRAALRANATIRGKGWKATWKREKGDVDWGRLVKELAIESDVIERFRKAGSRVLRVTETAE